MLCLCACEYIFYFSILFFQGCSSWRTLAVLVSSPHFVCGLDFVSCSNAGMFGGSLRRLPSLLSSPPCSHSICKFIPLWFSFPSISGSWKFPFVSCELSFTLKRLCVTHLFYVFVRVFLIYYMSIGRSFNYYLVARIFYSVISGLVIQNLRQYCILVMYNFHGRKCFWISKTLVTMCWSANILFPFFKIMKPEYC